jgi:hypothetical protein
MDWNRHHEKTTRSRVVNRDPLPATVRHAIARAEQAVPIYLSSDLSLALTVPIPRPASSAAGRVANPLTPVQNNRGARYRRRASAAADCTTRGRGVGRVNEFRAVWRRPSRRSARSTRATSRRRIPRSSSSRGPDPQTSGRCRGRKCQFTNLPESAKRGQSGDHD